jgi:hypothetical protein
MTTVATSDTARRQEGAQGRRARVHCTAFLAAEGITQVWATVAPTYDEDATTTAGLLAGTYVTHPEFGSGGASDPHDMNPSTGSGGGCYGDSGGPHFLGGRRATCSCRSPSPAMPYAGPADQTYRLDTPAARDFLDEFVILRS